MVANDTTTEILTCNLTLSSATAIDLEVIGPSNVAFTPTIIPQSRLVVGTTPLGSIPAGQWLTWNVLPGDCPTGGRYEVTIVATISGQVRRSFTVEMDVDG